MPSIPHLSQAIKPNSKLLRPFPPPITYKAIFQRLRSTTHREEARRLHGLAVVHGFLYSNHSLILGAQLVTTFVNLGRLQHALKVFDEMPLRNVFAWNAIIRGLNNVGRFADALDAHRSMTAEGLLADNFTYPLLLKACYEMQALEEGRKIVNLMELDTRKSNVFAQCAAIDMFAKCGSLGEARRVFDLMPVRDLVSWSAMIRGAVQAGEWEEALRLFGRMRLEGFKIDSVIVATLLPACGRLGNLVFGMGLHSCAVRSGIGDDLCLSNALIDMYCKCHCTYLAYLLFLSVKDKDVISWSTMISGYSQNGEYAKSMSMYYEMVLLALKPNASVIASILSSFSSLKYLEGGKEIHCYATRHGFLFNAFVATAVVDFYCRCGLLREAELVSFLFADKDISVWNSLVSGYASERDTDSAFRLIREIQEEGIKLDAITVVTVLPLCVESSMLTHGKELHGYIVRGCMGSTVSISNSLIDMYSKCGCLYLGVRIFQQMVDMDIVTYNTIISAVGMHGNGHLAISYFHQMKEDGIRPDKVTFIAILSACSHACLMDEGLMFYNSMIHEYGILPDMEHFSCMVDLYGRSGRLCDAWEFIQNLPVEPNIDVLGSLLAACRVHKMTNLAELVGKWIVEKNPEDPGYYVLLSNIYATCERWADGRMIRSMGMERGLTKKPGTSWIQIGSSLHSFNARYASDHSSDSIHAVLCILHLQIKDEEYTPIHASPNI